MKLSILQYNLLKKPPHLLILP